AQLDAPVRRSYPCGLDGRERVETAAVGLQRLGRGAVARRHIPAVVRAVHPPRRRAVRIRRRQIEPGRRKASVPGVQIARRAPRLLRHQLVRLNQLLILTLQLQECLYGFRVGGWIEDDELREDRRGGAAEDDRDGGGKDEAGSRPATHDRASYEGSVRSPERYTLSRCP